MTSAQNAHGKCAFCGISSKGENNTEKNYNLLGCNIIHNVIQTDSMQSFIVFKMVQFKSISNSCHYLQIYTQPKAAAVSVVETLRLGGIL